MSEKTELRIKMGFADNTTRTHTLPDIDENMEFTTVINAVKAINNNTAENVADFRKTFVSSGGASFTSIVGVNMVTTTTEVIYNG